MHTLRDDEVNADPILRLSGVHKFFGPLRAVNGVSVEVRAGEVVALCGRSGSGKSTLLRCVNFLETPDLGTIEVDGVVVEAGSSTRERNRRVRDLRLRTGMVFQDFNIFPHLTALQNVTEGLVTVKKLKRRDANAVGEALLGKVGLVEKAGVYPNRLSGGQRQRIAIARALAMEPKVMLFDEPTSALDPETIGEVLTVMRQVAVEGMTMLIATHEIGFAREVGHRMLFMHEGSVIEDGRPSEVIASDDPRISRFFAGMT